MGRWFCSGIRFHRWRDFTEWFPYFTARRIEWMKVGQRCQRCSRERRVVTIHGDQPWLGSVVSSEAAIPGS